MDAHDDIIAVAAGDHVILLNLDGLVLFDFRAEAGHTAECVLFNHAGDRIAYSTAGMSLSDRY